MKKPFFPLCAISIFLATQVVAQPSFQSSGVGSASQVSAQNQLNLLNGNWYSTQWKYGYTLQNGIGTATSTNSPNFQVGQRIIQLTPVAPNKFQGQQVYTDGKFYRVTATLLPDGRLQFEGEKNAKWTMDRAGASTAKSPQSNTGTRSAGTNEDGKNAFDAKDYEKALRIFTNLANTGDALSAANLGRMYANGLGVNKDDAEATRWFMIAAEKGNRQAQSVLGHRYRRGLGIERNYDQAMRWLRLAADQDYSIAQYELGLMYQMGQGVASSNSEAIKWFQLAAAQGHQQAKKSLEVLVTPVAHNNSVSTTSTSVTNTSDLSTFAKEKPVTSNEKNANVPESISFGLKALADKDYETAFIIFTSLAKKDDTIAQVNLGNMYAKGLGTKINDSLALKWWKAAAEKGNVDAQAQLGSLYRSNSIGQNFEEALRWLKLAASQKNAQAQFELGQMYELGHGVAPNKQLAIKWYGEASDQRHEQAEKNLDDLRRVQVVRSAPARQAQPNTYQSYKAIFVCIDPHGTGVDYNLAENLIRAAINGDHQNFGTLLTNRTFARYCEQAPGSPVTIRNDFNIIKIGENGLTEYVLIKTAPNVTVGAFTD